MKLNKITIISIPSALAILLAASAVASLATKNRIQLTTQSPTNYISMLEVQDITFISLKNNLNIIKVPLKNTALWNSSGHTVQLIQGNSILRQAQFNGSNILDPGDYRFQFEPIPDSSGETYTISIRQTEVNSETPIKIGIFGDKQPSYKVYYQTTNLLQKATSSLSHLIFLLTKDSIFTLSWLIAIIAVTLLSLNKK